MGDGFYLETMGCQMNVVDSEQIALLLGELGYTPRERPEDADLIVLNTCAIREKAERKVLGHLWQFKPLREANPRLLIAVGGCVAQQEEEVRKAAQGDSPSGYRLWHPKHPPPAGTASRRA